ncbi:tetratricopeptide repeat protein [Leptothoe sp. PORK10 BA2]|nr:tetratricopeptide repeat protein [Leptothoe sp. PORK10 BA2]MEA5464591.1 tetratricopeptide repeat protein [Leptothoe sp. PORK10 BA2]
MPIFPWGQYERAIDFHQQSLAIKREIGDRQGEANSLGNLGSAYYSLSQYERAIDFHQQSLAIDREIGDRQGEALSLNNLGATLIDTHHWQDAETVLNQSILAYESLRTKSSQGLCAAARPTARRQ